MTGHASTDRLRPKITDHAYLQLRALAAHLREEVARIGPGPVVDLGCGARPYASLFQSDYVGLDVAMLHGRPDCVATAEHTPVRSASVGTVLSTQHLEHAADPDAVLAEAYRMLMPGGRLLLSTHGVWVHHPDPHDYWRWTEEGLVKQFERHGFRVADVHRQGGLYTASLLLATYPLAGAARSGHAVLGGVAGAIIAACNVLGLILDSVARPLLPRHYASSSYLVVGEVPVSGRPERSRRGEGI